MKYLRLSLFILIFVVLFNIFKFNESFADVPIYRYIAPVWLQPYPDEIKIDCNLFLTNTNRMFRTDGQFFPNLFKRKKKKNQQIPKIQECAIKIYLPGPCNYSYIVYDENNNIVLKGKGSNGKFGPKEFVSDKKFIITQMEINQTIDYKIELDLTLYNYKQIKNKAYKEKEPAKKDKSSAAVTKQQEPAKKDNSAAAVTKQQEPVKKDNSAAALAKEKELAEDDNSSDDVVKEKIIGDPRYKYILANKNGQKIKNIYTYRITKHENGHLVQQSNLAQ